MNKLHTLSLSLVCAAFAALPAQATVVVHESFNYSAGAVGGNNGGTGFSGAWSNPFLDDFSITTSGLTFSNLQTSGGAATYAANFSNGYGSAIISRELASPYSSNTTVWGSYLLRATGEAGPWSGFTLANNPTMFNDASGYFGVSNSNDSLNSPESYNMYNGEQTSGYGSAMNLGETYMYLFKWDLQYRSQSKAWVLNADQFANFKTSDGELTEMELNAASSGTGASDVMAQIFAYSSGSSATSDWRTVSFDARNFFTSNDRIMTVDELRFSDTGLDDLTPISVPEPSRALLLLAGIAGAVFRRRRATHQ